MLQRGAYQAGSETRSRRSFSCRLDRKAGMEGLGVKERHRRWRYAVLCNLYRNGNDSVGLHADAEPEMGPVIASVSLGAERLFRLKKLNGSVVFAERLPHGSVLIMAGQTQKNFKHEVPKEPDVEQPRINLTFRRIKHP